MSRLPFDWDDIDLTFGIELPDLEASAKDEGACLSTVDGIFDLPGHDLTGGPLPFRQPFGRKPAAGRPRKREASHPSWDEFEDLSPSRRH